MNGFYYVYILVSETNFELHYTGRTRNLNARLAKHNRGGCIHTGKHKPWKIETALAFRSEVKARSFECYLKTGQVANLLDGTFKGFAPVAPQT